MKKTNKERKIILELGGWICSFWTAVTFVIARSVSRHRDIIKLSRMSFLILVIATVVLILDLKEISKTEDNQENDLDY